MINWAPLLGFGGELKLASHPIEHTEIVSQFDKILEDERNLGDNGFGAWAEYVCAPENKLALKPANLSFGEAAALPQAALVALQGLRDKGKIRSGQKVLIYGASGGIGTFAVQLAKSFGTEVTGVCSSRNLELVSSIGADHVIDYTQEDFTRNGRQYDLIVDAQGRHSIFDYRRALSPNGVYVMHGGATSSVNQIMFLGPLISLLGGRKLRILFHKANKGLDVMSEFLSTGQVVPVIDRCFPLAEAADALRYYGESKARGKVVIRVAHNTST